MQNCDPPIHDKEILSNVLSQMDANDLQPSEVKSIGKEVRFRENEESGDLSWLYIFIVAALVSVENISNIFLAFCNINLTSLKTLLDSRKKIFFEGITTSISRKERFRFDF